MKIIGIINKIDPGQACDQDLFINNNGANNNLATVATSLDEALQALQQDYQFLFDAGAVGVFGPGTKIAQAAIDMLTILIDSIEE